MSLCACALLGLQQSQPPGAAGPVGWGDTLTPSPAPVSSPGKGSHGRCGTGSPGGGTRARQPWALWSLPCSTRGHGDGGYGCGEEAPSHAGHGADAVAWLMVGTDFRAPLRSVVPTSPQRCPLWPAHPECTVSGHSGVGGGVELGYLLGVSCFPVADGGWSPVTQRAR